MMPVPEFVCGRKTLASFALSIIDGDNGTVSASKDARFATSEWAAFDANALIERYDLQVDLSGRNNAVQSQ